MPGSPKLSLAFIKDRLAHQLTWVGLDLLRGSMGPGHIFQSFINNPCRIKVLAVAMPFNWPPRVRASPWRQPLQSSTDLSYSVIYKLNKVEDRLLPTVQLTGKKHYAQVQSDIREQRSCRKPLLEKHSAMLDLFFTRYTFTLKRPPPRSPPVDSTFLSSSSLLSPHSFLSFMDFLSPQLL